MTIRSPIRSPLRSPISNPTEGKFAQGYRVKDVLASLGITAKFILDARPT